MKVSLNTIRFVNKHYNSAGDPAPEGADKLVERIGAQLAAVEEVIPFGQRFKDILIAKVINCQPHDNANKLSLCTIDDAGKVANVERDSAGHVQVVCGAPNVKAGLLVAWIPPGVTVPSTLGKEPLVLESRDIRGKTSHGMLASAAELGISDNHSGILEVDVDVAPGTSFNEAYNLVDEVIIDMENKMFTHRPDCFGQLGIARELEGIQQCPYKSPDWYTTNPNFPAIESDELKLVVRNEIPELVPRFTAITMSNISVKPSPVWLQILLTEIGIRPINNIVDYTNFFMYETGQPLHAYDYDKVKALDLNADHATIVIRHPQEAENLKLLGGKELKPRPEDIMIASSSKLIGLGGVMGGSDTEVDSDTKNIILECANFDMYAIRRSAMEHGLFTDAVTRFTKGQSPLQNLAVLAKIVDEIRQYATGKVASAAIDDNHVAAEVMSRNSLHEPVKVSKDFVNARLGSQLSAEDMAKLLSNVEFAVEVGGDELTVTAPFWRTDIEIPEDIVEEVGRLYGYDQLPQQLPRRSIVPAATDPLLATKSQVRNILSAAGANEILTYTFVHGGLLDKVGQNKDQAYQLANALSPDLQYYRLSLIPSLLEKVHPNIKQGFDEFALFEINPVHAKDFVDEAGLPIEDQRLAIVFAADEKTAKQKYAGAPYYQAKKYLVDLLADLGITQLVFEPATNHEPQQAISQAAIAPFEKQRSAIVKTKDGEFIGELGEFRSSVRKNLKLPDYIAGFELDTFQLMKLQGKTKRYQPIPRFPKVEQDITLKVSDSNISYGEILDALNIKLEELQKDLPGILLASLSPLDIYLKDKQTKHFTFRFKLASYERTLTAEEVNNLLNEIAGIATEKFGAQRI